MTGCSHKTFAKCVFTAFLLFTTASVAAEVSGEQRVVVAAKAKCSAPGVEEWEGTDQSGITKKCQAIFDACVDESLPCDTRKKNCAQYDKMDRDGSCFKKRRS